ncbi:MAG: carbohydrate kinase family protein [Candidatus Bathyarchaeota archaeon]|nr:MAG: carbohydrate kinase family protein [Candidatus Bathyarchaeota archaeon]
MGEEKPEHIHELLQSLEQAEPAGDFSVVVMPDFFSDRLVTFEGSARQFYDAIAEVAKRKGGSIHGIRQTASRGGNAANTAAALAALGAEVHPIISTGPLGHHLLRLNLEPLGVDLSHVKVHGETSLTTALEFTNQDERVNVMMCDLGSLEEFGPDNLTPEDLQLLQEANYVCVFDWAGTRRWGTELAEKVFSHVKKEGKGKAYYDTSDPSPKKNEVPTLMKKVLLSDIIDVLSVNENEASCYASHLSNKVKPPQQTLKTSKSAAECARILANRLSARIDLHTTAFSGSFTGKAEVTVPAFNVSISRVTGAGDAWNAGNIFGDALRLSDSCRLTLANAVAAYYISSGTGEHPTLPDLMDFLSKQR